MRSGIGYDVHRLVSGRKLFLGGVEIPYEKGLLGHSDADVLIHAVCDALLGASALGDIGMHFPDTDPAYKNIPGRILLKKTVQLLNAKGYWVVNVDVTVLAQAPKLSPYKRIMQQNLAEILHVTDDDVNIKATTTEGLGAIGNGEGIAAMCVAMVKRSDG
jgi:2-C-methyl-D-erythritol 2,4-cyclodiphosphate synthase